MAQELVTGALKYFEYHPWVKMNHHTHSQMLMKSLGTNKKKIVPLAQFSIDFPNQSTIAP